MDDQVIELLEKNNKLLAELVKYQRKEHRAQTWRWILQTVIHLLPFILLLLLGWWVFDIINANIQAVQANVDALKEGFANAWDGVTFWD
jgi:TRAP-type mannitol/chloroaromatic compound transport system permease small subunit